MPEKVTMEIDLTSQALVNIKPSVDPFVYALRDKVLAFGNYALSLSIVSIENARSATEDLAISGSLKKALEEKRKEYTAPLNEHIKAINTAFKTISDPLEVADRLLRDKVIAWQKVQEDIKRKAQELTALEAAAAVKRQEILESTGEIVEAPKVVAIFVPETDTSRVHAGLATAGAITNWKWIEVNFAEVPNEYKMLDASKITKVVRAGVRSIPGLEIYPEKGLRVTPIKGEKERNLN